MPGDFSRRTFDRKKHYSGVLIQQGRVQVDADPNEQLEIQDHRTETETIDVIGPCGVSLPNDGFKIDKLKNEKGPVRDLSIAPGRIYVDGILCELEAMRRPGYAWLRPDSDCRVHHDDRPSCPGTRPMAQDFSGCWYEGTRRANLPSRQENGRRDARSRFSESPRGHHSAGGQFPAPAVLPRPPGGVHSEQPAPEPAGQSAAEPLRPVPPRAPRRRCRLSLWRPGPIWPTSMPGSEKSTALTIRRCARWRWERRIPPSGSRTSGRCGWRALTKRSTVRRPARSCSGTWPSGCRGPPDGCVPWRKGLRRNLIPVRRCPRTLQPPGEPTVPCRDPHRRFARPGHVQVVPGERLGRDPDYSDQ